MALLIAKLILLNIIFIILGDNVMHTSLHFKRLVVFGVKKVSKTNNMK